MVPQRGLRLFALPSLGLILLSLPLCIAPFLIAFVLRFGAKLLSILLVHNKSISSKDIAAAALILAGCVVSLLASVLLLVPYYGACIHVPPPPANQTVHVVTDKDGAYEGKLFDTVWVTGKISVVSLSIDLGDAGYRIDATHVEPYE